MELRILLLATLVVWTVSSPVPSKQYRSDYEYDKITDAFYKLHKEGARLAYASEKCIEEGGELVKIMTDEDLAQVRAMMKKFPDLKESVLTATDVDSADDSEDKYECIVVTLDGELATESQFQDRPFVCKVSAKDRPYNEECGVHFNGYESKLSTTGSCYRVSTVQANWFEAQANCQAEGAHLVILNNEEELALLYNLLKDKPHDSETQYYAGVRAFLTSGAPVFKTVLNHTLEEVGYGPWEEGEPNDWHGGESCVALDTRRHGKYNDIVCSDKLPYVCEVSRDSPTTTSTPKSITKLPDVPVLPKQYRDYEYNEKTDAFYKLHSKSSSDLFAAKKCETEGAKLAKITSDEDLKQIQSMMTKLSDLEDLVMVAPDEESVPYRWITKYNVVNRRGKAETTTSRQELPFVCKVAAKDAPYSKECGVYSNDYESRISTTGSCYKVSKGVATWKEARTKCQAEGAHLVILNDEKELENLYNLLKGKPHDSETQYFAGVKADTTTEPRVFKTVFNQTLEEVGYGPWDENEPHQYGGGENCVALDMRRHGKYNDVWCHVRMPYVCESSGTPLEISATPSTPVSEPAVPVPWKQYRPDYEYNKNTDAFYKLHTDGAFANDASQRCKGEGAELVKITTDDDIKQVHSMMRKLSELEDYVMVAFGDKSVSEDYYDEYSSNYESKMVNRKGKIEKTIGRQQLPFVCKVAAKDAPYDKECDVHSNDYESRISTTGSCYRVSTAEATWKEAYENCQAEGAHLVILSNDEELKVLYDMLQEKPHNSETQYFAGVRADTTSESRVFKTVLNQTLEELGYGPWDENEPNDYEGGENCVALDTRRHGKYNDVWCHVKMPYVCESSRAPLEISSTPSIPKREPDVPVLPKQYRDYEYNEETDAFYKLHTKSSSDLYAAKVCKTEGAELAKITSDEDFKQIQSMMKKLSDFEDLVMVAPDEESGPYRWNTKYKVVNRRGKAEITTSRQELPFVCKVAAKDAPYSKECGVYSNDYESRISTTGSCYKVSTSEVTWKEAHAKCQADGAHLVILNDEKELEVLYNLLKDKPHDSETQYFAGVRADTTTEPRVFKTVLNQTLEDVGYGPWDENEPNQYGGGENCVALDMRRHGKYNDVWCHVRMPYVCESIPKNVSPVPVTTKKYRRDYEYNENTDAFYKLHTESLSESYAIKKCKTECAELVKITSDEDLNQIRSMMKKLSDLEDLVMVASDEESAPYHWNSKYNVVNRRGKAETTTSRQLLPFVCKVAAKDAPYSKECGVYSNDYESRISTTGSCYKVSTGEVTWKEAHAKCLVEGAHLVILNDEKELEVLYELLKDKPHDSETQYFAGVRADTTAEPRVFKTVLNQTLEEVGYGPWDENEPHQYGGGENCVALDMRRHGKYNDVWCHVRMPYVCESSGTPLEISATPSTPVSEPVLPVSSKQYRPGYEYNKNTDAFYKLHTESAFVNDASHRCKREGAELVKITTDDDIKQVHSMMRKLSELEDYVMVASDDESVFEDYYDENSSNYESKVVNRKGKIEKTTGRQQLPFVCKVAAKDAPYDKECDVYSNDYESRISTTGSCYRVSIAEATWKEAYENCQAEGAHLVILSSDEELEVLYYMLQEKPHLSETQYFAGVRADTTSEPRVFKTVLNQTLEELGYGPWDENEPNDYEGGENCVALDTRRHGKYNDVWCHVKMPYVCESSKAPLEISSTPSTPKSVSTHPSQSPSKQYRPDYEYNESTDAFYKLHAEGSSEYYASEKCKAEGAELVKVTTDEDLKHIRDMMKKLSDLDDYVMVACDEAPRSPYTWNAKSRVVNRRGKTEVTTSGQQLPFVCKVAAKDAPYNKECGVYSNDYESRISTTGSCYKVSTAEATWKEAYDNCQAEGAHLVILSSDEELKVLYNMLQEKPHNSETQYFAGVRADSTSEPRVFKTVLNQTLEEAGYGQWDENEPNDYEGGENCVALDTRRHGKYNDVWCHVKMPYVCESSGDPQENYVPPTPSVPTDVSADPITTKRYRPDYEYNKNCEAFFKLHEKALSKNDAAEKCKSEGAELLRIKFAQDLQQVLDMFTQLSDLEDLIMVASAVYERPSNDDCSAVNRKGEIVKTTARQELPFVCKVTLKNAPYDKECGVYSNDYESKISTTGSCYKVSTAEATWKEAYQNCQVDGAHLMILNNDEELKVLYDMLQEKPHTDRTQYFAGLRVDSTTGQRVFKTIFNKTIAEVGYGPWEENEPNDYEGGQNCVAVDANSHGKYDDVWCNIKMSYVCESSGDPRENYVPPTPSVRTDDPVVLVPSKLYRPDYEYNKKSDAFYKLHPESTSRFDALDKCRAEGAELIIITSDEDLEQVYAMMKKLSDLEDLVKVWPNEKNPKYEGNAVNRRGEIQWTLSWQKQPFVCKVAAKDAPYNEECGVHSNDYESKIWSTGSCYKVSTAKATWKEAYENCQADGAHLVILSTDEELEVLYNMLKDQPHDSETQYFAGVRVDATAEKRTFKTVLNETLGYGPWDENEPNDYGGGENCVALDMRRHGKYNDVWCHVRMPFVCESSGNPSTRIDVRMSSVSPDDPKHVSSSVPPKQYRPDYEYNKVADAFYKLHSEGAPKQEAIAKCIEEGATLLKITSEEDFKQVRAMMEKFPGLKEPVVVVSIETSEHFGDNYISKVMNRKGELQITSASQQLPFMCKVAAKNASYNKECDVYSNDYVSRISTTGSCYRVVTAEATWDEANSSCQADGAHLVILNSDEELKALYDMLNAMPLNSETQYFAGVTAHSNSESRVFKTVLNQTLEEVGYEPWEESEPNNFHDNENCVALDTRRHGKYNDVWCHVKMPYVCEKTLTNIQPPSKSSDTARVQRGVALSANLMRTFNFFFGPFSP